MLTGIRFSKTLNKNLVELDHFNRDMQNFFNNSIRAKKKSKNKEFNKNLYAILRDSFCLAMDNENEQMKSIGKLFNMKEYLLLEKTIYEMYQLDKAEDKLDQKIVINKAYPH